MYIFAFISWAILVGLPYLMNSEYGLGEIDEEELKNWTRFGEICTNEWNYSTFESAYLEIEKEENRKKYKKPKQVIKRKVLK